MARDAGIDVGTTRTKVAVYDAASRAVVARTSTRTPVDRRPSRTLLVQCDAGHVTTVGQQAVLQRGVVSGGEDVAAPLVVVVAGRPQRGRVVADGQPRLGAVGLVDVVGRTSRAPRSWTTGWTR